MRKSLLIFLLPFLLHLDVQAAGPVRKVYSDSIVPQTYQYIVRGDNALLMDVYRPDEPRPDSACVVFMFGGGFFSGSRNNQSTRLYCQQLAHAGYTAVAIDYRLHLRDVNGDTIRLTNMQGIFRDAINFAAEDCAEAVSFVCRNADTWGVCTRRIVLCGSSAGAIAVTQLDYCRANGLAPAAALPDEWKPAAVVAYSGAVYCDGRRPHYNTAPAPTFFLHGDKDKIVNYKKFPPILRLGLYGPKKLHRLFEKKGYPHWYFIYEGIGHEVSGLMSYTFQEFDAFVDKTLAGGRMQYDATLRDTNVRPTKWTTMNVFDLYKGGR